MTQPCRPRKNRTRKALLKGVGFTAPALPITPGTPWWALLGTLPARGIAGSPVMAVAVR
ncbi:hypothetical protein ABZZ04_26040 [Streptomyces sp. NPDC006435]|uniref:hypothetical protein n=1 Tax=Streptomyces sp. NPDC006435 TaxID=3154300 RepID=UPI0033BF6779